MKTFIILIASLILLFLCPEMFITIVIILLIIKWLSKSNKTMNELIKGLMKYHHDLKSGDGESQV